VLKLDTKIVLATSDIYKAVIKDLLPTPQRSHYLFNLRDLAKVIFGVCQVDKDRVSTPDQLTRLWVHEVLRVFGDRLINDEDKKFLLRSIRGVFTRDFNLNFDNVFTYLDQIDPVTRKGDGKVDTLEEMSRLVWSDIISVT
jgi:dynein heavy chain